jgi:hypothetical protein
LIIRKRRNERKKKKMKMKERVFAQGEKCIAE